ncbi:MAG: hypothetical protein QM612_07815 [Thermomonas sp.]|uniref:hypothetical protein n=1 Tax=Thermomonas sp. TaxID=1971895 RepID=UPI0039E669F0
MTGIDPALEAELSAVYEEVMWLAARSNISPSMARAWYTHVRAGKLSRRIRHFSGKVSWRAANEHDSVLRLEHHKRLQTTLTSLVATHLERAKPDKMEFIRTIIECENVHIVTFRENYDAMKASGDYKLAGIRLVPWRSLPRERQQVLWASVLRGRVANAEAFRPKP